MDKPIKMSQAIIYKPQNTKLFVFAIIDKLQIDVSKIKKTIDKQQKNILIQNIFFNY